MSFRRDQDIGQYTDDMTIAAAVAILLTAINAVSTAIASLNLSNVNTGENIVYALEVGRDWNWELTGSIIDKLETVRSAAEVAGLNTVTELRTFHAEFATLGTIITAQTVLVVAELQEFQTASLSKGDEVISTLLTGQEWDAEFTQLLVDKMETIRAANVAVGTDLGARLAALQALTQLCSDLGIAQGADMLTELQALGLSAATINLVLDDSLEEIKKTRTASELILGHDLVEGDD